MPLTDLVALIQSKPAVLLAGFLSSLCLLLLASAPYMVRAYRKQGRRFSGDAGTAPSEDLHRDSTNTRPVPTVSYSMLTVRQVITSVTSLGLATYRAPKHCIASGKV